MSTQRNEVRELAKHNGWGLSAGQLSDMFLSECVNVVTWWQGPYGDYTMLEHAELLLPNGTLQMRTTNMSDVREWLA